MRRIILVGLVTALAAGATGCSALGGGSGQASSALSSRRSRDRDIPHRPEARHPHVDRADVGGRRGEGGRDQEGRRGPALDRSRGPTAPTGNIVAPVLDISFGEADLKSEAKVEQLPRRTTVTLDATVLFAKDSAVIRSGARSRLTEVGRQLKGRGAGKVSITGYTDDLGSAAHGRTLSRQRAAAVATVLRRSLPASDFSFTVKGRGEVDPAVPNTSEKNRRVNRRVVLVYRKG